MARPNEFDIAGVMIGALPRSQMPWPVLVANDATGHIEQHLSSIPVRAITWHRRASGTVKPTAWPPLGPFAAAIMRIPKARAEVEMTLHAVASVVSPGGLIWLYGANDEGIKSAAQPMAALLGEVTTVETRGHCRVISARRPVSISGLKPKLEVWLQTVEVDIGASVRSFATYPGLFALGRLDAGTKLLLDQLPKLEPGARVLDFGCGMGVIAAAVHMRDATAQLTLIDNDAVALQAARENVPEAAYATNLATVAPASLDAILSNPPIHEGKVESYAALETLIKSAAKLLKRGGILQIVVQRRVGATEMLRAAFGTCTVVAEDGVFQVLRCVRV
ncbi:MAG: methyltransferase [Hyphomicrobiaceae bacterium]